MEPTSCFVASVTECIALAARTFSLADIPAVILYDQEKNALIAQPVARFARDYSAKERQKLQVLMRIDYGFWHLATALADKPGARIMDIGEKSSSRQTEPS